MTAQEHTAGSLAPHGRECCSKSELVTFRTAALGWSVGSQLTKGQIAAEDDPSRGAEGICQRHQQRGIAVRSRAVRQDKAIRAMSGRGVQESSNGNLIRLSFGELSKAGHDLSIMRQRSPSLRPPRHRVTISFALVVLTVSAALLPGYSSRVPKAKEPHSATTRCWRKQPATWVDMSRLGLLSTNWCGREAREC